jgi:hypothetical protein
MLKFDTFGSAIDLKRGATADYNDLLLHLLTEMAGKIHQLEARLDKLSDLTVGDEMDSFDERVLNVLDVRSGSARAALQLEDTDVQRWMMSAIEENSGEAFGHIEAEIDDKLIDFTDTCAFRDAVDEAISDGLTAKIEAALEGALHDAIIDAIGDAEDIVRKGLRSIL